MRTFLLALVTALAVIGISHSSHAAGCPTPNPNNSPGTPPNVAFQDNCNVPAASLNSAINAAAKANTTFFTVASYGAKGDGTTNDSAAFTSALNAASAVGGGIVWVPPTGHAYVLNTGLTIPQGVHLMGTGGLNWTAPIDNAVGDWTKNGSWLQCNDTTNPCLTIAGNSSSVEGLNFWYTQPTPTTTSACANPCTFVSYSYTTYPYTILVANTASVGVWIKDNNIANGSHCVDWEGPSSGITAVYSGITRNSFGCLKKGMLLHFIDNTLTIDHNRWETWWYQGTAQWWWAMESSTNNYIAVDAQYLANAQFIGNEFSFVGTVFSFTDATVTSGFGAITFAAANLQGQGNSFNEVCTAMTVASSTTHVTGEFDNTILATDSTTSPVSGQCARFQPYAINLASDNANFTFNGIQGAYVQSLAFIGGGGASIHGQLHLKNVGVSQFSQYAAGANAMATDATGSIIDTSATTPYIYPSTSFTAGTICSGAGCGSSATFTLGNLEIGGASTTNRQLMFSQTVAAQPLGNTIGQEVWGWRTDGTNSNLELDRYSTPGTFTDSPIVVNKTTGNINLNDAFFAAQKTVATLPTCNASEGGAWFYITDFNAAPTYRNTTFSGSGTIGGLVLCNGTSWEQH